MTEINYAGTADHSTIDYPGEVAAVIHLCGCPYRCPWCQNKELVLLDEKTCRKTDIEKIIKELNKNFLITAVTITGGEPLMQEETIELLKKLKEETKLLVKIDTNGHYPERLEKALQYLDYLAMDLKAPLDDRYGRAIGLRDHWENNIEKIKESLKILKKWGNLKEARTTIVPGHTDNEKAIQEIAETVKETGFDDYTLQEYRPENTLDKEYLKKKSPGHKKMKKLGEAAKKILPSTRVRIVTQENGFQEIK